MGARDSSNSRMRCVMFRFESESPPILWTSSWLIARPPKSPPVPGSLYFRSRSSARKRWTADECSSSAGPSTKSAQSTSLPSVTSSRARDPGRVLRNDPRLPHEAAQLIACVDCTSTRLAYRGPCRTVRGFQLGNVTGGGWHRGRPSASPGTPPDRLPSSGTGRKRRPDVCRQSFAGADHHWRGAGKDCAEGCTAGRRRVFVLPSARGGMENGV